MSEKHRPTPQTRQKVEIMAAGGFPQASIAGVLEIAEKTLRKHYELELKHGAAKISNAVASKLVAKALAGDTTSMIFYLKTRCGWKETTVNEVDFKIPKLEIEILDEK